MNYQENKEFIKYYVKDVIEDLGPMMKTLIESVKYTDRELEKIFLDHINKEEFKRFCDIFNDLSCCIDEDYMEPFLIINNYEFIFKGEWEYDDYIDIYDDYVQIYLEKKKKKKQK